MKQKNKVFPAQRRYMEKCPVICTHVKKEIKEKIVQMAKEQGLTPAQFIRNILEKVIQEEKRKQSFFAKIKKLIG